MIDVASIPAQLGHAIALIMVKHTIEHALESVMPKYWKVKVDKVKCIAIAAHIGQAIAYAVSGSCACCKVQYLEVLNAPRQ